LELADAVDAAYGRTTVDSYIEDEWQQALDAARKLNLDIAAQASRLKDYAE